MRIGSRLLNHRCLPGMAGIWLVTGVVWSSGCCITRAPSPVGAKPGIVVQELVKSSRSWDGALLPPYPAGQPEITIRRITIPAGARLELHEHPVLNAGVLLHGQLTVVTTDGKTLSLKEGEPIVEVVKTAHYGINRGDQPAEILVVYAGTTNLPITVMMGK